ncbi:hypothetical protein CKO11_03440 [Rhodobacter sp. TJ_12]|nr:hypothetical protein [Rhodobacter sp. TJ_12]
MWGIVFLLPKFVGVAYSFIICPVPHARKRMALMIELAFTRLMPALYRHLTLEKEKTCLAQR